MTVGLSSRKSVGMHQFDGPTLEVDLSRLAENYRYLRDQFTGEVCAAVVKADAYGLGAQAVSEALAEAGCSIFFVATLSEGIALRRTQPDAQIMIFHGVDDGEAMAFINHKLTPVLNNPTQLARWSQAVAGREGCPSVLHLDTGMARLGFTESEFDAIAQEQVEHAQVMMLMSHLACASEPEHPLNEAQLDRFLILSEKFPELPTSLPNSAGIMLGESWHDDVARPGCALYGVNPNGADPCVMKPVARLSAPVIQIRTLDAEQSVGYGATQTLPAGTRLATIALGYADGVHRILSGKLSGYVGDSAVPMVGRVTMDLLTFDISALPEDNVPERIELMNDIQTVNHLAQQADTIGYEILTSLGARIARHYTNWSAQ